MPMVLLILAVKLKREMARLSPHGGEKVPDVLGLLIGRSIVQSRLPRAEATGHTLPWLTNRFSVTFVTKNSDM